MCRSQALLLLLVASACLAQRGAAAAAATELSAGPIVHVQEAASRNPPYSHKEIDYAARHEVEMFAHESQRSGFRRRLLDEQAGGEEIPVVAADVAGLTIQSSTPAPDQAKLDGQTKAALEEAKAEHPKPEPEQPTPEPEVSAAISDRGRKHRCCTRPGDCWCWHMHTLSHRVHMRCRFHTRVHARVQYMRYAGKREYRRNWMPKTPPVKKPAPKPYHQPSRYHRPSRGAHQHPQLYTPDGDDDDDHEQEHAAPKAGYGKDAYARYKAMHRKDAAGDEGHADYGSDSSNTTAPEATKPDASYSAKPKPKAPGYGRQHGYHHAKPQHPKPAHSKPHHKQAYMPHKYAPQYAQHGHAGKDEDEHMLYVRNGTDAGSSHSKPHYAKKGRHHHHKPQHVPKPAHHQPAKPYAPQPAKPYAPRHQAQEGAKPYSGTQAGKPAYAYKPNPYAFATEPANVAKPAATPQLQEPKL
jgi:hypothetical protein